MEQPKMSSTIKARLNALKMVPVIAKYPGNTAREIMWIKGTAKYISGSIIYDTSFSRLYYHTGIIPENTLAVGDFILTIDAWAEAKNEKEFLAILDKPQPRPKGVHIYIDDVLHSVGESLFKEDSNIKKLLKTRSHGDIWFSCLKTVDTSGNVTQYYASKPCRDRHMRRISQKITMLSQKEERLLEQQAETDPDTDQAVNIRGELDQVAAELEALSSVLHSIHDGGRE